VLPACACSHADRKDFFDHLGLVKKTNDPYFSLALGTGKRVGFINFSDEVGPVLWFNLYACAKVCLGLVDSSVTYGLES